MVWEVNFVYIFWLSQYYMLASKLFPQKNYLPRYVLWDQRGSKYSICICSEEIAFLSGDFGHGNHQDPWTEILIKTFFWKHIRNKLNA